MNKDIGIRLRKLRDSLGMRNQTEFANELGITQTVLSKYETGTVDIPDELKIKISELGVNLHWLILGNGEMFLQKQLETGQKHLPIYRPSELPEGSFIVPMLDQRLSAGNGSYIPEADEARALVHVPAYLSRYGKNIKALAVDGDSMYPTLSRGDMVVCDSCGWSGEGIYALRMSGSGFVKRLTKAPGKLVIISDNPKYPTREEPEESQDIQIIGRVHCAIKEME